MDVGDFRCPVSFRVRVYDTKLNYRTHNVIPYKSDKSDTVIFSMMRSSEMVIVGLRDGHCFAENDRLSGPKRKEFPIEEDIRNVVCNMLAHNNQIIVVDNPDEVQDSLF